MLVCHSCCPSCALFPGLPFAPCNGEEYHRPFVLCLRTLDCMFFCRVRHIRPFSGGRVAMFETGAGFFFGARLLCVFMITF